MSFQRGSVYCSRRMRGDFKPSGCIDVCPDCDVWMYSPNLQPESERPSAHQNFLILYPPATTHSDATVRSGSSKPIDPRCRSIKTASRCRSVRRRGRFGHRHRSSSRRCSLGCRSGGRGSDWCAHSILTVLGSSGGRARQSRYGRRRPRRFGNRGKGPIIERVAGCRERKDFAKLSSAPGLVVGSKDGGGTVPTERRFQRDE